MIPDVLIEHEPSRWRNAQPVFLVREKSDDLARAPEALAALARFNNFSGETGVVLCAREGALIGAGDGSDPFAAAAGAEKLPEGDYRIDGASAAQCFAWLLGAYRFDRYKAARTPAARLIAPEGLDTRQARREAAATGFVRDLVNTPAADMGPDALEREARALAAAHDARATVITGDDLLTQNFPLVHAVGRAAAIAPRLIDIAWGRQGAPRVTLVGKGVTFDSGGLDIKGAEGMSLMKKDMGGGAHALGLARMIMEAELDLSLRVIVPAVENAIAGNAFRPGDIIRSRKGLTVEIGNTDAEGRLILCDALTYVQRFEPQATVDVATLTGACVVALGKFAAGLMSKHDDLADELLAAGESVFDRAWRLPLWDEYQTQLESAFADVYNIGGKNAGAITAGCFLARFTEGQRWAHLDIAGVANGDGRKGMASGRPVGLLTQWLIDQAG